MNSSQKTAAYKEAKLMYGKYGVGVWHLGEAL